MPELNDLSICKHCGQNIVWYAGPPERWVHGTNNNNWKMTQCVGFESVAEPSKEHNIINLLKQIDEL